MSETVDSVPIREIEASPVRRRHVADDR